MLASLGQLGGQGQRIVVDPHGVERLALGRAPHDHRAPAVQVDTDVLSLLHGALLSSLGCCCGSSECCRTRSPTARGGPAHASVPSSSMSTISSQLGHRPPGPSRRQNTLHSGQRRSSKRSSQLGHSYTTLAIPTTTMGPPCSAPSPVAHTRPVTQERRSAPSSHQTKVCIPRCRGRVRHRWAQRGRHRRLSTSGGDVDPECHTTGRRRLVR